VVVWLAIRLRRRLRRAGGASEKGKGKEKKVYPVIRQTGSGYQENRRTGGESEIKEQIWGKKSGAKYRTLLSKPNILVHWS